MPFDRDHRSSILRQRAPDYLRVAVECITREYPHMPSYVATDPGSHPSHREFHPAFYGCFDWHSCVEMHWAIVRLLRRCPGADREHIARDTLDDLLTPDNLAVEARFFAEPNHRTLERPYGWGWLLTLHHELATWDDPNGRRWAAAVSPFADLLATNLVMWLPKLTYPQRVGVHPNTAFALSRSYDHATRRAEQGDDALLTAIQTAALRWFLGDTDYPAHYEPSGADFLSPALVEADLMSRVMDRTAFISWLDRFLPPLGGNQSDALSEPAIVSDITDGQIAHLHGLNLSRAWALVDIAARLTDNDPRTAALLAAAERHAAASLPAVAGSDYMVEHWLAAYATALLSA